LERFETEVRHTGNAIVRQLRILIPILEGIKAEKIQVPLIWMICLEITDFDSEGKGPCSDQLLVHGKGFVLSHHQQEQEKALEGRRLEV